MLKVINEYGLFRMRWDILMSFLIVLSIFIIPFQFAFLYEINVKGSIIVYVIDVFFILTICINRRTSFRYAGEEIVFIRKGKLQVLSEEGGDIYCEYGPGEYFGNLSIMLKENRSASIRAKTFFETFILDSNAFYSIKSDFPEFLDVMKKMSVEKPEKITNY